MQRQYISSLDLKKRKEAENSDIDVVSKTILWGSETGLYAFVFNNTQDNRII